MSDETNDGRYDWERRNDCRGDSAAFQGGGTVAPTRLRGVLTMGDLTKVFSFIAGAACIATVAVAAAASAQQQTPPRAPGTVTAMVVMTPTGPATCATWVQ